jgi:hypothetical protein
VTWLRNPHASEVREMLAKTTPPYTGFTSVLWVLTYEILAFRFLCHDHRLDIRSGTSGSTTC